MAKDRSAAVPGSLTIHNIDIAPHVIGDLVRQGVTEERVKEKVLNLYRRRNCWKPLTKLVSEDRSRIESRHVFQRRCVTPCKDFVARALLALPEFAREALLNSLGAYYWRWNTHSEVQLGVKFSERAGVDTAYVHHFRERRTRGERPRRGR